MRNLRDYIARVAVGPEEIIVHTDVFSGVLEGVKLTYYNLYDCHLQIRKVIDGCGHVSNFESALLVCGVQVGVSNVVLRHNSAVWIYNGTDHVTDRHTGVQTNYNDLPINKLSIGHTALYYKRKVLETPEKVELIEALETLETYYEVVDGCATTYNLYFTDYVIRLSRSNFMIRYIYRSDFYTFSMPNVIWPDSYTYGVYEMPDGIIDEERYIYQIILQIETPDLSATHINYKNLISNMPIKERKKIPFVDFPNVDFTNAKTEFIRTSPAQTIIDGKLLLINKLYSVFVMVQNIRKFTALRNDRWFRSIHVKKEGYSETTGYYEYYLQVIGNHMMFW